MTLQAMIAPIVVVIITGVSLMYAGIQTDTFLSGILIIIGLVVLIGGGIGIIKKMA